MGAITEAFGITDVTSDLVGGGGDDAADAAREAAQIQADYQREALEYLKESDALPRQFRESALKSLAGAYGMEGGEGSQQEMIDRARDAPIYDAIMGTQDASEEAIMRNASATGGLRSGNANAALADNAQQLENQALLTSYNQQMQGIQGLAGLPSLAPQIAAGTSGIGQTLGQGEIAAAQAQQQGNQMGLNNILGIAGTAASFFSDFRLKDNITQIGEKRGLPYYSWDWNEKAKEIGLEGSSEGWMAHEVAEVHPEAVMESHGYLVVNEEMLHGV